MQTVKSKKSKLGPVSAYGHMGKSTKKSLILGSLDRAEWVLGAQEVYSGLLGEAEKEDLTRLVKTGQLWLSHKL